jgi:hypothetical protein
VDAFIAIFLIYLCFEYLASFMSGFYIAGVELHRQGEVPGPGAAWNN